MENGQPMRSVSRAIAALRAINQFGLLTMMEISKASGVPYATAIRIVQTLLAEGLIEHVPVGNRYRATAMVQTLATGFQQDDRLISVARPHLVSLTKTTGSPISIWIRVGSNMILRHCTHANASLTLRQCHRGCTLPILNSAAGKLSLAFATQHERRRILQTVRLGQQSDPEFQTFADLCQSLKNAFSDGYAVQVGNRSTLALTETASISVPIMSAGCFAAAMTMMFFTNAITPETAIGTYLADLRATAAMIGHELIGLGQRRANDSAKHPHWIAQHIRVVAQ